MLKLEIIEALDMIKEVTQTYIEQIHINQNKYDFSFSVFVPVLSLFFFSRWKLVMLRKIPSIAKNPFPNDCKLTNIEPDSWTARQGTVVLIGYRPSLHSILCSLGPFWMIGWKY